MTTISEVEALKNRFKNIQPNTKITIVVRVVGFLDRTYESQVIYLGNIRKSMKNPKFYEVELQDRFRANNKTKYFLQLGSIIIDFRNGWDFEKNGRFI